MAPHSSAPALKIPWMEEPGRLRSTGSLRVGHDWATLFHFSLSCIEGNGNPLQCSCLKNPRDGGAWWAAVYGITQSRTRLKWFSSSSSSNIKICMIVAVMKSVLNNSCCSTAYLEHPTYKTLSSLRFYGDISWGDATCHLHLHPILYDIW